MTAVLENLLPEGWLREALATRRRLAPDDVFGLVLAIGRNLVGALEVWEDGGWSNTTDVRQGGRERVDDYGGSSTTAGIRQRRPEQATSLAKLRCDFGLSEAREAAITFADHVPLPGMQRKVGVALTGGRRALRAVVGCGRYILKPQASAPDLPENEALTMRVARTAGVETADNALITLADGSSALIVKRFDRPTTGGKCRVEDFCQLDGKAPGEKYDADAERCVAILAKYATEPMLEVAKLYRRILVAWWTGNNNLHLKNLALVTDADGVTRLSPAYDAQCTALWAPEAGLALGVCGKQHDLRRADWLRYADVCGLRRPAAERVLREVHAAIEAALPLIAAATIPADARRRYAALLAERTRQLA